MEKLRQIEKAIGVSTMEEKWERWKRNSCYGALMEVFERFGEARIHPSLWDDHDWRKELNLWQTAVETCLLQAERTGIVVSEEILTTIDALPIAQARAERRA